MNQFEQKVDIIPPNLDLVPKKKSGQKSLKQKEQNLLSVIMSSNLHLIPEFSAIFGLNQQQCQSQNADIKFSNAFIKTYSQNRNNQVFLNYLDGQLDKWFQHAKIITDAPKEFHNSINLGATLLIKHQLTVESENPEENFRVLIQQKLKKKFYKASKNLENEIKEQLNQIFQEFVNHPSERVFEFINESTELQIMIHTNVFPCPKPKIYLEGSILQGSQIQNLKRQFFHILYSQTQNSYYDLCLTKESSNLANNLPFITQEIKVFRENCEEVIEFQISKIKDKSKSIPLPYKEVKASKQQILDQLLVKYGRQIVQDPKEKQVEKELGCKSENTNEKKVKQKKKVVQQKEEPTYIQIIQQRFAQNKIDVLKLENDLQLIKADNSKTAYCGLNSFYELSQMSQKDVIKRLQNHYRISLKQFTNPCYFVGLLFLSFQQLDKKQQTSQFEISHASIQGLALQIDKFESIGVVYGSVLGFKIVNQIQLPKFFVFILKNMLGQNTTSYENNPLRVFICSQCLCFDKFGEHICQNQ